MIVFGEKIFSYYHTIDYKQNFKIPQEILKDPRLQQSLSLVFCLSFKKAVSDFWLMDRNN